MFTLISLLFFISFKKPYLLSQHFLQWCVFEKTSVLKKPPCGFFQCSCSSPPCALLGFLYLWHLLLSKLIFVSCSTSVHFLLQHVLEGGVAAWSHASYIGRPSFVAWTARHYSVFYSVMQCIAVHYNVVYSHLSTVYLHFWFSCLNLASLELYLFLIFHLFIKILVTCTLHCTLQYLVIVRDIWYRVLK